MINNYNKFYRVLSIKISHGTITSKILAKVENIKGSGSSQRIGLVALKIKDMPRKRKINILQTLKNQQIKVI